MVHLQPPRHLKLIGSCLHFMCIVLCVFDINFSARSSYRKNWWVQVPQITLAHCHNEQKLLDSSLNLRHKANYFATRI